LDLPGRFEAGAILMKRAILIVALAAVAAVTAPSAPAKPSLTVLLAGGAEESQISIGLSPDGRNYVIDSLVPLEVGGEICTHPEGQSNQLLCAAPPIGGFEVNAGGGDDSVTVSRDVRIPVTLRGGPGADRLVGGGAGDKLVGGQGDDVLIGWGGHDSLFGGPGADRVLGGSGNDILRGEAGPDVLVGGPGRNTLVP
jgi:RTX calcium-binding nonapeptide repeat (4 copies)